MPNDTAHFPADEFDHLDRVNQAAPEADGSGLPEDAPRVCTITNCWETTDIVVDAPGWKATCPIHGLVAVDDGSEPEDASPMAVAHRAILAGRAQVRAQIARLRAERVRINDEIRPLVEEEKRLGQALRPFDKAIAKAKKSTS